MIGSAANATLIKKWHDKVSDNWMMDFSSPPEGWTYVGCGAYRRVYLGPDGVVYKLEKHQGDEQSNEGEIKAIERILKENSMPEGSRLPKACYFTDSRVLAMEKLGKTLSELSSALSGEDYSRYMRIKSNIVSQCKVFDLHTANVMIDDKTKELVPVDLGDTVELSDVW